MAATMPHMAPRNLMPCRWQFGIKGSSRVRLFEMQEARGKMQRKDAEHKRHERCRNFGRPLCKLVFEKLNIHRVLFEEYTALGIRRNKWPKKAFEDISPFWQPFPV